MNLVVTVEEHFQRRPDGTVWTAGPMTYSFWQRYLDVFDSVRVLARSQRVHNTAFSNAYRQADGDGVTFVPLPEYRGPKQYLQVRKQFHELARGAVHGDDAVLLRAGCSPLAADIESMLSTRGQPFGVEVVADPYQILSPGAVRHPLRPVFRRMFAQQLRRQCHGAAAAAYVTKDALQRRYPPGPETFATYYSDVELPELAFVSTPRQWQEAPTSLTIASIGSMEQVYKGFDVLIDAVDIGRRGGLDLRLLIVGDGRYREELELQAARLHLNDHVRFVGQVPAGKAVRAALDQADLFVLASRTEGLPRVIIEAMARGLPCIGTRVGGIPELLSDEELVQPNDADGLAEKISQLATNPALLTERSQHSLRRAEVYRPELLQARRDDFLRQLRARTEAALPGHAPHRRAKNHHGIDNSRTRLAQEWPKS